MDLRAVGIPRIRFFPDNLDGEAQLAVLAEFFALPRGPAADGTFSCFLYFPPKGGSESYAAEIRHAWDGAEFSFAE